MYGDGRTSDIAPVNGKNTYDSSIMMEKMLPSETGKAFLPIFKELYEYGFPSAIFIIKAEY